jgi:putative membrane protein
MMMRNFWKSGCMAAAMIVASPVVAQTLSADSYVMKAGAGDLYEKSSSQLVLETTSNPSVKSFASMMVSDHSTSTAKVKAAAVKSGITPKPPMLAPKQQAMITALKATKGSARDTLYISQQKAAHQDALALHKNYNMSGTAAPLKAAAGEIVPVVEHHIEMLRTMK